MNIKHFTDYRSYLIAHIQEKKMAKKSWTLGSWANVLSLKSTSSISKVISGERHPGPEITTKLIKYFKFSSSEEDYFKDLIRFQKVKKDPQLAVAILEKIGKEHPDGSMQILNNDTFVIISNWYGLAIREMIRTEKFIADPHWISKIFEFKVTVVEANRCIKDLVSCNLIKLNNEDQYEVTSNRIKTENDIDKEAIKRYHEQSIELAKQAVRKFSVAERELQATTLVMREENLEQAKNLVREFREKFTRLFEETSGDRVYQMQIQLFPLTKNINKED